MKNETNKVIQPTDNPTLEQVLEQLTITQGQLVKSEKMAALGCLIAGISHEVSTPLGIAITTHSIINDEHKQLQEKISQQQLSMKDMEHYCHAVAHALEMQEGNLLRVKQLIEDFKKTAVDQHKFTVEEINIKTYYQKVLSTLNSILKQKQADITFNCPDEITITTYPGAHAQILINLITNSIRHGFTDGKNNHIHINVHQTHSQAPVMVEYQDNGIGLTEQAQLHVFEPFFTTASEQGGIGLGMAIVKDLLTQKLCGNIEYEPCEQGAKFTYQFQHCLPKSD